MAYSYKLRSSTLGLYEEEGKRRFVTLAAGSLVSAEADVLTENEAPPSAMVDVRFQERNIALFLTDLRERAEPVNLFTSNPEKSELGEPPRRDRLSDLSAGSYSSNLISRSEVGRILIDELNRTRTGYEEARKVFQKLVAEVPSGLPHPDGSLRITCAGQRNKAALSAYIRAFHELEAFTKFGAIPKRLEKPTSHPDSDSDGD